MTRLWGGRFEEEPAPEMLAFTRSVSFDIALAAQDCAVLSAHVRALERASVIAPEEAAEALNAIEGIAVDLDTGVAAADPEDEDVHTTVERLLLERAPEAGPKVRAGLSRNDRVAAAFRLWMRDASHAIVSDIAALIETLMARAADAGDALLPGYTHLQRAQPVRLSHHLLAHAFALERDARRLLDAAGRTAVSPLGAGALAGSTLELDAAPAARELGFDGFMLNSLDAVSARDFVAETLAAAAICGTHCSRLAEEIVLWCTAEFGFARLSDAYSTGSSLMPQKRNPDVAELVRAKTGRLVGDLTGLLVTLKGLPLAYNRDLQEDKEPAFDAVRTLRGMLGALRGAIGSIAFDPEAMERAVTDGGSLATDLAEYLVGRGIAFRDAHDIVGKAAARADAQGRGLSDLELEELRAFSDAFDAGVRDVLSVRASVDRRAAPGPSRASVDAQVAALRAVVGDLRAAVEDPVPG